MGKRHATRCVALQALYALDANPGISPRESIEVAFAQADEEGVRPERGRLEAMVTGAWERRDEIDRAIENASRNWKLSRMDRVDRSILRLGVFELLAQDDVPAPVALSEAVELAKEFGAPDSSAFINGLLDKVARDLRSEEVKSR